MSDKTIRDLMEDTLYRLRFHKVSPEIRNLHRALSMGRYGYTGANKEK